MSDCTGSHFDAAVVEAIIQNLSTFNNEHYACSIYYLIANMELNVQTLKTIKKLIKYIPHTNDNYVNAVDRINAFEVTHNDQIYRYGEYKHALKCLREKTDAMKIERDNVVEDLKNVKAELSLAEARRKVVLDNIYEAENKLALLKCDIEVAKLMNDRHVGAAPTPEPTTRLSGYDPSTLQITDFNLFASDIGTYSYEIKSVLGKNTLTFKQQYILGFVLAQYSNVGLHSNKTYKSVPYLMGMLLDAPASIIAASNFDPEGTTQSEIALKAYYTRYITDKPSFNRIELMKSVIIESDGINFTDWVKSYCRMHFTPLERRDMGDDIGINPYHPATIQYL